MDYREFILFFFLSERFFRVSFNLNSGLYLCCRIARRVWNILLHRWHLPRCFCCGHLSSKHSRFVLPNVWVPSARTRSKSPAFWRSYWTTRAARKCTRNLRRRCSDSRTESTVRTCRKRPHCSFSFRSSANRNLLASSIQLFSKKWRLLWLILQRGWLAQKRYSNLLSW